MVCKIWPAQKSQTQNVTPNSNVPKLGSWNVRYPETECDNRPTNSVRCQIERIVHSYFLRIAHADSHMHATPVAKPTV